MYDAALQFGSLARQKSTVLRDLGLEPRQYLLATVHRPYNTDVPENLGDILAAFEAIGEPVVFPVHPRTRKKITELGKGFNLQPATSNVKLIEPVGYLDMLMLEQHARLILTDSGGMQKEAYFFGVPCITLRPETEWVETVEAGWNVLAGADRGRIVQTAREFTPPAARPGFYGQGDGAGQIATALGISSYPSGKN
jgi:UDP-N-acetylglucosamine 2-epimerase